MMREVLERVSHGVDAFSKIGFKGEKLFAFLGESSNLRAGADKDLLPRSPKSTSKVHPTDLLARECFKHRLK